MAISPLLVQSGPWLLARAAAWQPTARLVADAIVVELGKALDELERHVVVCGYGDVGRELVNEIVRRDFRCVIVEQNPYLIERLRGAGIPHVYGDATNPAVLAACRLGQARIVAITLPDPAAAEIILRHAKRENPALDVIARGRAEEDHAALISAGASEVVHPEFEAGLEFVRHTLHRFGVDRTQIQALLGRRRRDFYRREQR
jgi:CPA2 family monovalent cation:H+ antiporter-2